MRDNKSYVVREAVPNVWSADREGATTKLSSSSKNDSGPGCCWPQLTALGSTDAECDEVFKIWMGTIMEDIVHDCSYFAPGPHLTLSLAVTQWQNDQISCIRCTSDNTNVKERRRQLAEQLCSDDDKSPNSSSVIALLIIIMYPSSLVSVTSASINRR